MVVGDLKPAL